MCGIAGIYKIKNQRVNREELKKMTDLMIHRGPDDEGFYIKDNIGLGHRRLAIIDLSKAGHQPMTNEDGSLWIVQNGEIYNYLELRKELEKRGHIFKSQTDTEVIIHSYEEWGSDCLHKFNGMWAFALWDERKKILFISRDRLGIKPFHYYFDSSVFIFASEIKPILSLGIKTEPNEELIYDFLKHGMLDHTEETFFKNINKLPAAHFGKINQNGELNFKRYWDFAVSNEIRAKNKKEEEKNIQEFLEIFTDTVRLRLRSDVPVGTCLSGGLDSSSVAMVMNKLLKEGGVQEIDKYQNTFSSCFEDKKFDEREYIEEIIQKTGVKKNLIFPQAEEFITELDKFLWHQEEPVRGTSMYAQYKVFEKAKKEGVKVLLDGQGGDELLGGYRKFYIFYLRYLLEKNYYSKCLKEAFSLFSSPPILKTLNLLSGLRYFKIGEKIQNIEKLLKNNLKNQFLDKKLNFGYNPKLGERFKEDLTIWSLPVLLRYEDKNSSAHSVEARLPFLDYRLVEKIASLPLDQKMRRGWTKYILREAMKGLLPEKVRKRKAKIGFVTPEQVWFRTILQEEVKAVFQNLRFLANYLNFNNLEEEFQKYIVGKSLFSNDVFFRFFILELWGRKYFL